MKKSIIAIFTIVIISLMIAIPSCTDLSTDLKPTEGFIEVTGGKVWYQIVGSGEGTPLLVLHGGPGASSIYLKPLEAIGIDRPVIFYDQLGGGKSSNLTDTSLWTIEHFVDGITQVRDALGLKKIHLYGHSWGTILAVNYVLNQPTGVQSLILSSPVLSVPRWIHDSDSLLSTLPDSLQKVIRYHEQEKTTDAPEYQSAIMFYYGQFFARRQPWSDELNTTFAQVNTALYNYTWGPSEFTITGVLNNYDCTDRLGKITIPTLLTAGQFDYCTPSTVQYYQSMIPNAEFALLKECAHLTMQDDPVADIKVIRDYLSRQE